MWKLRLSGLPRGPGLHVSLSQHRSGQQDEHLGLPPWRRMVGWCRHSGWSPQSSLRILSSAGTVPGARQVLGDSRHHSLGVGKPALGSALSASSVAEGCRGQAGGFPVGTSARGWDGRRRSPPLASVLQKWLSSPFPSPSFSPAALEPEISSLEVLDMDTKATQLLLLQQDKAPLPSPAPSGHSQTSCFTNQGYFFFHLPDALEIEACQVYFTYNPCTEAEPEEGAPVGSPLVPLPPLAGEDDAYCTFPPGDDLLLFSPSLHSGPSTPHSLAGVAGASEERLHPPLQEKAPQDWSPPPLESPTPAAPDPVGFQSPLEQALGEAGGEVAAPRPVDGADSPPQGQFRAPTSPYTDTDVYLSLQELQAQDPAHLV